MSDLTFKFHLNKTSEDYTCQNDDQIIQPFEKFAKDQNKELKDFAFYYRSSLIKDSEYTTSINKSIFGNTKAKKFDIFVVLLQLEESKKKRPEEKNEIIIEKKIETKEEKKEPKEEKKETKEEKKEEEKKEFYYDIICPECKTSAIIDINNDKADLGLKILNCENFHNLKNKAYDIYEELDLDRIPLRCDICSSYLTPPENQLYYCSCGSNVCSECNNSHDDEKLNEKGHIKKDYKDKNYFCFKHDKSFISYCIDCNSNICEKCKDSHKSHKIYEFTEIAPTSDDINKWKVNYEKHQVQLKNFITSIKESFNNVVNTVESNLNNYILIEKTLIKRYNNGNGLKNFQLLRNLTNENIFTNPIFKELEKHSVPDEKMDIKTKLTFLSEKYEIISRLKKGEVNMNTEIKSDGKHSIKIEYQIPENPINRYVKLFDKVFIKNNSDKISITIDGNKLEKTIYEKGKVKKKGEFESFVEKGYYFNKKKSPKFTVLLEEEGKCITDLSYMLNNCKNVTSVNFKTWDNSKVTSMEAMFQLTNLKSIPEELFKTQNPNLTNIKAMFCKCVNIKEIPNLNNLFYKGNNIKDIGMLFNGCRQLQKINGQSWNADNITNMSYVFNRCESLEEIHLGNVKTNKVKNMCGLFNGCIKLIKIPSSMSNWNIQNVEDISIMFQDCKTLEKVDIRNYNVANVKDMSGLFSKCANLKSINSFKIWAPYKVKEMVGMFNECKKLNSIELGKWNLTNVSNASGMFYKCEVLKTLKNGDSLFKFVDKNNKTNTENIFDQSGIEDKQKIKDAWEPKKK